MSYTGEVLVCTDCGTVFQGDKPGDRCPECDSARTDYEEQPAVKKTKFEVYDSEVTEDGLLVGRAPDYTTANYEGDPAREGEPPFHGPTRRVGHMRAVEPEKWTPANLLAACLHEAEKRGWKLHAPNNGFATAKDSALNFLTRTWYPHVEHRSWYGTYGVLWFDLAAGEE